MDWRRSRQSDNVEVRGGGRVMRAGGGLGLGASRWSWASVFPSAGARSRSSAFSSTTAASSGKATARPRTQPPQQAEQIEFVRAILGSTEDTWGEIFQASGKRYAAPRMVLFQGAVDSACGRASAAVGPFYCPADRQVYLDLDFFREMEERFHAAGDLARAYVIAHEVGHHVQNLTRRDAEGRTRTRRGSATEGADGLSVRQELQADCYAGVWAKTAEDRLNWLEPGDVESALAAATAIGDDALQRQAQGYAVPDSFTHGTSAQRVRWFKAGLTGGSVGDCDTFAAAQP